jgi:mannose-6-phosphate isomerase-like protein (cupin superfamily)
MRHIAVSILVAASASLWAADPQGFVQWNSTLLKNYEKTLAPKINAQKIASEQLGRFGNHSFMIAHREGDGEAEVHETQADVFFVQTGEATLVVGGEVKDGRTAAKGEIRGPSITGGEKKKLGAGDVVHIPAKVPHQLLVETGKQFTYMIVKIDAGF